MYIFRTFFFLNIFILTSLNCQAATNPFIAVFIDAKTEKALGPFPYVRIQTARAIAKMREAGAKGTVIKYYLDQALPGTGDDELAAELKRFPVVLQARFDEDEKTPAPFPTRFDISNRVHGNTDKLLKGKSGWIPLEKLSKNCAGFGFVDVASESGMQVPLIVSYQSHLVP